MGSIDWQINRSMLECTKYLLENEVNCDVNFRIGEDPENIKAHKLILCMRSPVFDRMFNGCFEESEKDPVIPDMTAAAFQTLLRYCYYECLDMEDDTALDVLYASTKYMFPVLEKAARKKLIEILSATNIWDVYKYAISVRDAELYDACKMYFEGDVTPVREALCTEEFLNIPHVALSDFLHINDHVDDTLGPSEHAWSLDDYHSEEEATYKHNFGISISEIELFQACNRWAEAECLRQEIKASGANKRIVLRECLFLIRFPTMLYKDLVNVVYPTGILSQTEKDHLCQYKHKETDSQCQLEFLSRERQFVVKIAEPSNIVFIESEVRVMLSRVWTLKSGHFKVTVKDETSNNSWTMNYDTKHENHISSKTEDKQFLLHFLDIKLQLLEPGTKYSITAERTQRSDPPGPKLLRDCVVVGGLSPFTEIKITRGPDIKNVISSLTLCLV